MADEKMTGNIRVVRSKHPEPILTDDEVREGVQKDGLTVQALGVWAYLRYLDESGMTNFTLEDLQQGFWSSDAREVKNGYDTLVALGYIQE